jgi:hypothetical protein
MARSPLLLVGLLGLLLAASLALATLPGRRDQGRLYTVVQVEDGLAHQPERLLGQTVQLRAIAEQCPLWGTPDSGLHCMGSQPVLVDQEASLTAPLPLTWRPQSPLLAFLRRVPLLGGIVPARQGVGWMAPATYRVQLRPVPAISCGYLPCYQALLLDAAPGVLGEG